jgi:hypothetical protein
MSTAPDLSEGSMSGKQGCTGVSGFPFIMFPEVEHGGGPDGRLCKRCPDHRISPGRKRVGMNGQKKKNGSTAIQNTPRIMIEHCQQDQTGFLEIKKSFPGVLPRSSDFPCFCNFPDGKRRQGIRRRPEFPGQVRPGKLRRKERGTDTGNNDLLCIG